MPDQLNPLSSMIEHARGCLAQAARLRRELPDAATMQRWETFYQGLDDMAVNHDRIGAILTDLLTASDAAMLFSRVSDAAAALTGVYGPSAADKRIPKTHMTRDGASTLCHGPWVAGTLVYRVDDVTCTLCRDLLPVTRDFKPRDRVTAIGEPGTWIVTDVMATRLEVVREGDDANPRAYVSLPRRNCRHVSTGPSSGQPESLEESRQRWMAFDRLAETGPPRPTFDGELHTMRLIEPVADRTIEEMTRAVALPPRAPAQRRSVIRRVTEAVRSYSQARLDVE